MSSEQMHLQNRAITAEDHEQLKNMQDYLINHNAPNTKYNLQIYQLQ